MPLPSVDEAAGTDLPASLATTGRIISGTPATGSVTGAGDRDWFAVDLTAGQIYEVTMQGLTLTDTYIYGIRDSAGAYMPDSSDDDGGPGLDSRVTFTPATSGTYFIESGGYSNRTGSYSVAVAPRSTLTGTEGDDWLVWQADTFGALGGAGRDMLSFAGLSARVRVTLWADNTGIVDLGRGDFYQVMNGIESVTGTSLGDVFYDYSGGLVRGLGGADTFYLRSPGGQYDGGAGKDTAWFNAGSAEAVSVSLLRGRGWAGDAAGSTFRFIENVTGTSGNDTLTGDHGANLLDGQYGDDLLIGNGGNDTLDGYSGHDTVVFSFARSEYGITTEGANVLVTHQGGSGADGTDRLAHVEVLRFADGDLLL